MAKSKQNRLLLIVLILVVVALIAVAAIKSRTQKKGEEVEVEKVELRTIHETVSASGKVFPEKEIKISSDVSGEIVELYVEEGDSVRAGQVLARIDPEAYLSAVERGKASVNNSKSNLAMQESSIQSSLAQIEQIKAQLSNARKIHVRNDQLFAEGIISEADFESSLASVQQLEANLKAAEANYNAAKKSAEAAKFSVQSAEAGLKELQTSLNRTTIAAPTDGIVSKLNVEQGERVVGTIQMTGTEMMRIANFNSMEVQVEVSENDILRVSMGDSVDIEVDAYLDEIFRGTVTEIGNSALNASSGGQVVLTSDQVTNFVVKIRILPESYMGLAEKYGKIPFRPGMSASVEIYTETASDAISVPIQAVTTRPLSAIPGEDPTDEEEDDEKEIVFVFRNDTAAIVQVKTGIQDNQYIQILEGLAEGDEIVTGPYSAISRKLESGDDLVAKEDDSEDSNGK